MLAQRRPESSGQMKCFISICAVTIVLWGSYVFAAEQKDSAPPPHFRVFSLKHISAGRAINYLAEAKIATASQLPNTNTLLVTAQPRDLIKATAILKLVDTTEKFVIVNLFRSSQDLPATEKIDAELSDILIGTFSDPPTAPGKPKAIVDTCNNTLFVLAPAGKIERIISTIDRLQTQTLPAKPKDTNDVEEVEFFDELFKSLANAQESAAELKLTAEPNEMPIFFPEQQETKSEPAAAVIPQEKLEPAKPEEIIPAEKPEPEPAKPRIYTPDPTSLADETLELNLPKKLKIIDLLDLVGKYLHLDYMFNEADLKDKQVSLRIQGPIKVKELYPLVEAVLNFQGFAMTRKGNLVTIVPKARVLEIDPTLLKNDQDKIKYGDVIVTNVFKLKHADTSSAENLLRRMKLGLNIESVPETKTLMVTGYTYRMPRIEQVLAMIDKPGKPKKFRFRALKYTMAETLAPKIKTFADQLGTISISITAPSPAKKKAAPKKTPRRRQPTPSKPAKTTAEPGTPTVYLDADVRTNRILMIGLDEQLDIVDELIDTLDVAQKDLRKLRLYEIQNVGAEEVLQKLQQLGIVSTARTTRGRTTKTTREGKATTPTRTSTTKEAPLAEEPQIVTVEATNSLLVNATAEQHARIAEIIAYVDSEQIQAASNYVVYPLENQDPADLGSILEKLIMETMTKEDKTGKIERTGTRRLTEEDITIVADENTFSLIVYANKKNQKWIKDLVGKLDKRRPQVLIDVTLVQITKDDAFNFDLDLISSIPDLASTSGQVPELTSNVYDLLNSPESDRKRFIELRKSKGGTFTGFYGDNEINALLTAVETRRYGRVMARPKLLVNDNELGTIQTIDTTYVTKTEVSLTTGDNPIQTEIISYPDYSAGITLNIKPHISEGNMLRLEITLNRSGFTSELEGDKPPNKADADVSTIVTVPDRSTIILGGMEKIQHNKGGEKVPFFGDLPLIGGAFRTVSKSGGHDKLYIFVKAHILRPGVELALQDLREVSLKNRERFEKLEREMDEYEDWPGIKPEPMDPIKVLEED